MLNKLQKYIFRTWNNEFVKAPVSYRLIPPILIDLLAVMIVLSAIFNLVKYLFLY